MANGNVWSCDYETGPLDLNRLMMLWQGTAPTVAFDPSASDYDRHNLLDWMWFGYKVFDYPESVGASWVMHRRNCETPARTWCIQD